MKLGRAQRQNILHYRLLLLLFFGNGTPLAVKAVLIIREFNHVRKLFVTTSQILIGRRIYSVSNLESRESDRTENSCVSTKSCSINRWSAAENSIICCNNKNLHTSLKLPNLVSNQNIVYSKEKI